MPILSCEERYSKDPQFHALVEQMYYYIAKLEYTASELREAAMYAAYLHACRHPAPVLLQFLREQGLKR